MRRWRWIVFVLAAIAMVRVEHTGVSINQLEPVEAIMVRMEEGRICVETDTGARGIGTDLTKAVENLYVSSSSKIFLETAQYLLLDTKTDALAEKMNGIVRPNTRVCRFRGEEDLSQVVLYLRNHPPKRRLRDVVLQNNEIQTLYYQKGRGQLVE